MKKGSHHSKETKRKIIEYLKGNILSEETKNKISKAIKGRMLSIEHKRKISKSLKGHVGWWRGKKRSEEAKRKVSEALKGKLVPDERRKRISNTLTGRHLSEEHKNKIGKANRNPSEETRIRLRNAAKRRSTEDIKNYLRRRIPSSLENKFQGIVDKYNLPYKYVGDGKIFIERYNPDFINTNNKKIAIEVYARYYKKRNYENIKEWELNRQKVFNKYGWKIIFFNEIELTEENVLKRLKQ